MSIVAMEFFGMPLVAWGGITVLLVLIIQILMGLKIIKVDFKYHKNVAFLLLGLALVHGLAAMIYVLER